MSTPPTDEQREQIEALLEVEVRGAKAGIYGREWCEACGELGSFTGFVGAMAAHVAGGRFVCGSCSRSEDGTTVGNLRSAELDRLILERGYRFCAGCGREVILRGRRVDEARRRPFHCPACQDLDISETARRRYLEHQAKHEGGLERAAARVAWAREGLERLLADPPTGRRGSNPEAGDNED